MAKVNVLIHSGGKLKRMEDRFAKILIKLKKARYVDDECIEKNIDLFEKANVQNPPAPDVEKAKRKRKPKAAPATDVDNGLLEQTSNSNDELDLGN